MYSTYETSNEELGIRDTSFVSITTDGNNSLCVNCSLGAQGENYETVYFYYNSELLMVGATFCILFAIIGTTGNLISILALSKNKRLRNSTTAFIVNLCVADMLYCGFTMPLTAVTFIDRNWKNGDALCKLFALIKFTNGMVSIFTVVAITVNRYILIVFPNVYSRMYTKKKIAMIICCLWIFPLMLIFLPLFNVWGTLEYNPRVGDCGVMDLNGKSPRSFIFVVVLIIPSILFIGCYLKIYFVVKKSVGRTQRMGEPGISDNTCATRRSYCPQKEEHNLKKITFHAYLREKKEFRLLRIVLVIFIIYLLSTFPIALIKLFRKEGELPALNILAYITYFSASVINPVIYIIMSREYRIAYKELFLSMIH